MNENRIAASAQLFIRLLLCSVDKRRQMLNEYSELLDPRLLLNIISFNQEFSDSGNQNVLKSVSNLVLEVGEFLGSDRQTTAIRKQTADILLQWGIRQFDNDQVIVAFNCWQKSLIIYQTIHNRQGEANSLGNLGLAYGALGKFELAISYHTQHLLISQAIKDREGEAIAIGNLGLAYHNLGQFERAISHHSQYLFISQQIQYREGEAIAIGNLGIAYRALGQFEEAIFYHKKSLAISREIQNPKGEATSLGNLGTAYHSLGQFERAISYHKESLAIRQAIKDREGEAIAIGNLGLAYHDLGQFERAISYHKESLAIKQEIQNCQGEATSLANLGAAFCSLGKYEEAIAFYKQSLAICQEIQKPQGEAVSLRGLGNIYGSLGQFEEAIFYHKKSLAISRAIKDSQGEANSLGSLSDAYGVLEQFEEAIFYHEQSLVISRKIKDRQGEAISLNNIGSVYLQLQQQEKAIQSYQDCLKIATPKTMPAECLKAGRNLGNLGFTQGNWYLALEGYEPAIQAVEQLRKGSTTDKRRQEIIAEAISVYANAVQCYINLKQYDKAVETADRSRSRHLADLFASKDLYPKGEIPPEVEEYYRLQQQSDRLRFSENDGTKALATTHQASRNSDTIIEKIKELEEEKKKAWLKIRSKDQVLAGQLQPDPLSFKDMQALIPDAETAILNFYTTSEHTHIFRVQLIIAKTSNSKLIIKISTAKRKNRRNILNIPLSPRYFDSGSYLFND